METRICTKCGNEYPATLEYFQKSATSKFGLKSWCKTCSNEHENIKRKAKRELKEQNSIKPKDGFKICTKCKRELEMSDTYFHRNKNTKDGFERQCKECKGFKFNKSRIKVKAKIKEGYQICSLCGIELPATTEYFYVDKTVKSGIKIMCKKCCYKYEEKRKESRKKLREESKVGEDGFKICKKCGKEFPETNEYFSKHKECKNGLSPICKECKREESEIYRNKEEVKEHLRQKWQDNREFNLEKGRIYRETHKDYIKQWRSENKELNVMHCQRRAARKKALPSTLTIKQWEQIKEDFNNKCAYCGKELPLQQEHFKALSKGGEYTINNIIPACQKCNVSKKDKDFNDWYPKYKYYSKKREKFILDYLNYKDGKQQLTIAI